MNGLENEETRTRYVKGLVEELERVKGDKEAEKAVRAELAAMGEKAEAPAKRAEKRPARKRSTRKG